MEFYCNWKRSKKKIFPDKKVVNEIGYKKFRGFKFYSTSEIAIGNSVWDEPLGRIAIEASSRKCLPIISNKGGLSESKNIAIVLKKNEPNEIFELLKKLTKNKKYLRNKQNLFFEKNNFEIQKISRKLDTLRSNLIENNKARDEFFNKRILHIANFNENADGRLYYSFSNKLNYGFIKNNYIVETISDRNYLKSNRTLFKPLNKLEKFNNKILKTLKKLSPHVLVIGHVFNIDERIFAYCKKKLLKFVRGILTLFHLNS